MKTKNFKPQYEAPSVEVSALDGSQPLCLSVFTGFFADDTGTAGKPGEGFFGNDEIDY